ncbi:MAG: hypothetical protein U0Z44_11110 [Kouleothrix sp.]
MAIFLALGYLFGNVPFVKRELRDRPLAIVLISVLPMVFEYVRSPAACQGPGSLTSTSTHSAWFKPCGFCLAAQD